ncbi:MAG: hypothetical protein WAU86_13730 [Oricola sp.]
MTMPRRFALLLVALRHYAGGWHRRAFVCFAKERGKLLPQQAVAPARM